MKRAEQRRRQRQRRPTPQPFLGEAEKPAAQHDFLGKPRHDRNADNRDQHADVVIADHTIAPERGDHSDDSRKQHQPDAESDAEFGRSALQREFADRPPLDHQAKHCIDRDENRGGDDRDDHRHDIALVRPERRIDERGQQSCNERREDRQHQQSRRIAHDPEEGVGWSGFVHGIASRLRQVCCYGVLLKSNGLLSRCGWAMNGSSEQGVEMIRTLKLFGCALLLGAAASAPRPAPLATRAPGRFRSQAVRDRNHDYAYNGRGPGDLVSPGVTVNLPGAIPTVTLDRVVPAAEPAPSADLAKYYPLVRAVEFQSNAKPAFRGTPTFIRGWIALPPGYDGKDRFPTVYSDGGFGSSLASAKRSAANMMRLMADGKAPPMIWVYLDHAGGTGTHEFADSANNGPWGTALTSELIPSLEREYRMDARPSGRFLTGHSSGGWSTLWLQVRYPKIFGGSWPTSPDPSDFHDFTNIDLYAPNANFYAGADGKPRPLIRDHGKVVANMVDFARSEAVMGPYGGQIASFEWVFSPRGIDGRPVPLFDRATGRIDPAVVAYWHDNYDIANILARDWAALKPDLDGKIHLTVGTADTFYLDGPAHRLEAVMKALGAKTDFRYLPDKTLFDLYERGGD